MPLPDMTPAQLLAGAREVAERAPDAVLAKNRVGNLAIVRGGEQIGWLDLRYGVAHWDDEARWDEPATGSPPAAPVPSRR
jgi:hypothetical protein